MCIRVDRIEPAVAEKDIACWKFLEVIEGKNGERITVTPYAFAKILEGTFRTRIPFCAVGAVCPIERLYGEGWNIDIGYVHTYAEMNLGLLDDSFEYLIEPLGDRDEYIREATAERLGVDEKPKCLALQIWRCTIPKGAKYLRGYDDGRPSYASDRIVFEKMELEIGESLAYFRNWNARQEIYEKFIEKHNKE